jgi:hypothetical protein
VPACFGGKLEIQPVKLPVEAVHPERREFEVKETVEASRQGVEAARIALADARKDDTKQAQRPLLEAALRAAETRHDALLATIQAERLEDAGKKDSPEWKRTAEAATRVQRTASVAVAERTLLELQNQIADLEAKTKSGGAAAGKANGDLDAAKKKLPDAAAAVEKAKQELAGPPSTAYKPRVDTNYPAESSGRRLAFAKWLTDAKNPLAARVAVNHIWLRHFGAGLVPNPADFGRNTKEAINPRLIDWLAASLMENRWQMKPLHRMIVMSAVYRQDSRPDPAMAKLDPDNLYLWRMNSRRLEAEAVRDNVLWVSGGLDETMGGPEIDHKMGLESRRRSIYLRQAAEKQVEFLQIFDGPSVTECYERKQTVMPQQALALANSELALKRSVELSKQLEAKAGGDTKVFVEEAYLRLLGRMPTAQERRLCDEFLKRQPGAQVASNAPVTPAAGSRARQNLVLVLLNHHEFVTVR